MQGTGSTGVVRPPPSSPRPWLTPPFSGSPRSSAQGDALARKLLKLMTSCRRVPHWRPFPTRMASIGRSMQADRGRRDAAGLAPDLLEVGSSWTDAVLFAQARRAAAGGEPRPPAGNSRACRSFSPRRGTALETIHRAGHSCQPSPGHGRANRFAPSGRRRRCPPVAVAAAAAATTSRSTWCCRPISTLSSPTSSRSIVAWSARPERRSPGALCAELDTFWRRRPAMRSTLDDLAPRRSSPTSPRCGTRRNIAGFRT